MQDEMQLHIDLLEADLRRQGLAPAEAHRRARAAFGSVLAWRDDIRQALGWRLIDELRADVTYACRLLRRSPVFAGVAVLSLALGIGANTAIFSLIDTVLLKSLPVQDPERLVLFGNANSAGITIGFPDSSVDLFSYPTYQEMRKRSQVFSDIAAIHSFPSRVHGVVNANGSSGDQEQIKAQLVSGTYFSVLGVKAMGGRTFSAEDDVIPGGHPVVVASFSWWQRRFGGE